ncbi:MAG: AMIN domain-containing protein, partial [Methylococcales bacterium]|nr:AMIN domain-containing protein [Methylococcales bacterium]
MKMQVRDNTQRLSQSGNRNAVRLAGLILLAGMAFVSQQLQAATNALIDISHVTLSGNKQQLALTMDGPAVEPKAFTIDNPARIALDLPDTANELDERNIRISSGLLQNVTTVEAGGRTRVVINLSSLTPFQTSVKGNQLLITLDSNANSSEDNTSDLLVAAASNSNKVEVDDKCNVSERV